MSGNWGNQTGCDSESDEEIDWKASDLENLVATFGQVPTKRGIRFRVKRANLNLLSNEQILPEL
eukprot:9919719-Heterocapsa_arctica.AAC.1